jgi:hypothetical protein
MYDAVVEETTKLHEELQQQQQAAGAAAVRAWYGPVLGSVGVPSLCEEGLVFSERLHCMEQLAQWDVIKEQVGLGGGRRQLQALWNVAGGCCDKDALHLVPKLRIRVMHGVVQSGWLYGEKQGKDGAMGCRRGGGRGCRARQLGTGVMCSVMLSVC